MAQHASILSLKDNFSGPPSEICLNPKVFRGLHKADTPLGNSCANRDSTSAPSPVPPPSAPSLSSPLYMDMGIIPHLRVELRLLQDHASLLKYLVLSNRDRQASVSATLAALQPDKPVGVSAAPPPFADTTQPSAYGDTESIHFSDFKD